MTNAPDPSHTGGDPPAPRRLGDAWLGWDARRDGLAVEFRDPPVLFVLFHTLLALLAAGAFALLLWLAAPRLAQWGVGSAALFSAGVAGGLLWLAPSLGLWAALLGVRPRGAAARLLLHSALAAQPPAARLAALVGIDADRVGHAFLELSNHLARGARSRGARGLLVLAPRCLRADLLRGLRALASDSGVEVVVVAGGEEARARIRDLDPAGVLAIACERDLVAGVREVAADRPVIALANRRPEGPCRNSEIDLALAGEKLAELQRLTARG